MCFSACRFQHTYTHPYDMKQHLPVLRLHFMEGKYTCPVVPIPVPQQKTIAITRTIQSSSRSTTTPAARRNPRAHTAKTSETRSVATASNASLGFMEDDRDNAARWRNIMKWVTEKKRLCERMEEDTDSDTESDTESDTDSDTDSDTEEEES